MRIVDEFRTLKEYCSLHVNLEPYQSNFPNINDNTIVYIKNESCSQRLFFDEKYDTILKSVQQDELELSDYDVINFDCSQVCLNKLSIEDSTYITIYENSILYKKITC
jgi:hypothetical protein